MDEKTFCMLMHLSQLANYIFPFAGIVLPIVMWATNKDQSSTVDRHGKNIFNFMLSMVIYSIVLTFMLFVMAVLSAIIVGLPVGALFVLPAYMAIGVASVVFVIIAAVKTSNGEYWPYPLCIRFFK